MKTNPLLGQEIADHLIKLGIETPLMRNPRIETTRSAALADKERRQEKIADHFAIIMGALGLDLSNDSLSDTPARVAKMFMQEIFSGLNYENFPKCTVIDNSMGADEMVLERNITMNSTCEHHFLPIVGKAHVAYIPGKKVLGLSKMNRIVQFFAARPQVQERLTQQIHAALCFILETEDVAVIIEAEHMCVRTRGVEDACSDTVTSKISGAFRNPSTRSEFITLSQK
jgi:GTP cyclohydrolase IA